MIYKKFKTLKEALSFIETSFINDDENLNIRLYREDTSVNIYTVQLH
jgi:hypothetical protein